MKTQWQVRLMLGLCNNFDPLAMITICGNGVSPRLAFLAQRIALVCNPRDVENWGGAN
jgi:hypothetical protein